MILWLVGGSSPVTAELVKRGRGRHEVTLAIQAAISSGSRSAARTSTSRSGPQREFYFRCLPDTGDPRGPKGK